MGSPAFADLLAAPWPRVGDMPSVALGPRLRALALAAAVAAAGAASEAASGTGQPKAFLGRSAGVPGAPEGAGEAITVS